MKSVQSWLLAGFATALLASSGCGGSTSNGGLETASAVSARPVSLMSATKGIGGGCYGQCGYLNVDMRIENIAYAKQVNVVYTADTYGGRWYSFPAHYVGSLDDGFEHWNAGFNVGNRDSVITFALSYTVDGQTYWDNNGGLNYQR